MPDIRIGSVPYFLCCLSANGPTARPFGPALRALILSGLHSVTRVPFSPSDIVSASILYTCSLLSLRILALSGLALRVFVGRLLLVYRRFIPFLELSRL